MIYYKNIKENNIKRVLSSFLALVLVLLICTNVNAVSIQCAEYHPEKDDIITKAISFLESSTYEQYGCEKGQSINITVLDVLEDNKLIDHISGLVAAALHKMKEIDVSKNDLPIFSNINNNLQLQKSYVKFHNHLHKAENVTYDYFIPSYTVDSCEVGEELAIVRITEQLDFKYTELDESSYVLTHFIISLYKYNEDWFITHIVSDDEFYMSYWKVGFDLDKQVRAYDSSEIEESIIMEEENTANQTLSLGINRTYIAQNAVNYALTYSTASDSGSVPSYYNSNFLFFSEGCQSFASQCVWAGLGGSNTQSDINAKSGMDATGTKTWWCTGSAYSNWASCSQFRTYTNAVKSSSTETGVYCDTYDAGASETDLGFSSSTLLGSILHVKGYSSGSPVALGHAVIITKVLGRTRSTVYYTAYNQCKRNVKLSLSFPANGNSYDTIHVMVPRYFRVSSSDPSNYLYGDLLAPVGAGSTKTVSGHSIVAVSNLSIKVSCEGVQYYYLTSSNTDTITASVYFSQAGTWDVEISGTGLSSYTFRIRVT